MLTLILNAKYKTYSYSLLVLIWIFSVSEGFSRSEIKGKLVNCNSCRVSIIIDNSDLEIDKTFIPAKPDGFGNFVFEFKQQIWPRVYMLEVNAERFPIYVEPDSQVWLTVNGAGDHSRVFFTEGLIAENNHLQSWFSENGWVGDRVPNNIWFEESQVGINPTIYSEFKIKPEYLRVDHAIAYYKQLISDVQYNLPEGLTFTYQHFMYTYVKHAAPAILYSILGQEELTITEKQKVTSATFTNTFSEDDRLSPAFMPHLRSYVDFETKNANTTKADFNSYFNFIWQNSNQVSSSLRNEFLLHILQNELSPETVLNLKPTVESFAKSLNDLDQMAMLLADYQVAISKANGRKAPNFILENTKGELVSLESLEGKNIYLAFWSSACKPCIEGMIKSKNNKSLLNDEDIIFLYISTDLVKNTWLANKYVRNSVSNDLHLWIGKSQPELHEYNAITLPTYYFIDKRGNFVTRFPNSWDSEFVQFVNQQF